MPDPTTRGKDAFRMLPAIDEVLRDPEIERLAASAGKSLVQSFVASTIDAWRAEIRTGALASEGLARRLADGELAARVTELVRREHSAGVVRCVNASGVVLNTGLGRAPVHPEAAERMAEAARSYCVLEVDRESGERNQRDERLGELLARLTGAEAGIGVNNNAGAVFLALQTFAGGREAIVSRGELVEIGGSFRVPDVMARANATLREVGTTNRTRIADYRSAIGERTGLMMKVHTSNFRVMGFTEEVSARELAELGRECSITTAFDLGSGLVEESDATSIRELLGGEPLVREAVASGVDVVMFSGDKLLGGPQAGLLVGQRAPIEALRKNPIYRALRLDKVALAGLEKTLELWLAGRGGEIPARAMLMVPLDELEKRAHALGERIGRIAGFTASVVSDSSQPGSGSAPGVYLPTFAVRVVHDKLSASRLARALRLGDVPVFVRVHEGAVLVDPRTLLRGDELELVTALLRLDSAPN